MYKVVYEVDVYTVYFEGSYDTCKAWIDKNYNDELAIISCETGRLMSIVWK